MKISHYFLKIIFILTGIFLSYAQAFDRIVSIGGGLTETIYALDGQEQLIAVDTSSYYPEEVKQLPDIGYMRSLSAEPILSLNPDIILIKGGSGPASVIEQLENLGIKIEIFSTVMTFDELYQQNLKIGKILNQSEKALKLNAALKKKEENIYKLQKQLKNKPRILALLSASHGTYRAAGGDTGVQQMINNTAAINIFEEQKGYKNISAEGILKHKPDFIFISHIGEDAPMARQKFLAHPILSEYFDEEQILAYDPLILFNLSIRSLDVAEDIINIYLKQLQVK